MLCMRHLKEADTLMSRIGRGVLVLKLVTINELI